MPEGDTVHQVAMAIRPDLVGRTVSRIECRDAAIKALAGRPVVDVRAHGKHLLIELDGGLMLRSHLGMYGTWHRYRVGEPWRKPASRASLALWVGGKVLVCFNAKELQCLTAAGLSWRDLQRHLGPDLICAKLDYHAIPTRARGLLSAQTPAVDVLLDQRVASGIGNVYKSELLFIRRVHPMRPLGDLSDDQLCDLYRSASDLLRRNVRAGPRITRPSSRGPRHWVYRRAGLSCLVCTDLVRRQTLGRDLRSTYWCQSCQN